MKCLRSKSVWQWTKVAGTIIKPWATEFVTGIPAKDTEKLVTSIAKNEENTGNTAPAHVKRLASNSENKGN
eukprot:11212666-Lingulodinium_polyedra.AAC.1